MKGTRLLRVAIFILQIIGGFPFKRVTEKPIKVKVRGKEVWGEDGRGGRRTRKASPNNNNNRNKNDIVCVDDKVNSNNNGTLRQKAEKSSLNNNNNNNNNSITTSTNIHVTTTKYYQPSTWWKLWSFLIAFTLQYFLVLDIYELSCYNIEGKSSPTRFITLLLSELVGTGKSHITLLYLMWHINLALNVANKMHQLALLTDTVKDKSFCGYYLLISAIVYTVSAATVIIVNHSLFLEDSGKLSLVHQNCKTIIDYSAASFTLMFLFTTVYLEKLFYRSVRLSLAKHFYRNFTSRVSPGLTDTGASICEALTLTTGWISEEVILGEIMSDNKQNISFSEEHNNNERISFRRIYQQGIFQTSTTVNIEDGNGSEGHNDTQKISPIEQVQEGICDNVTEVFQGKKGVNDSGIYDLVHSDDDSEVQQDRQLLKGIREMLLRIHALHRLLLQYLALPVLLLTFGCVCQSIVSFYYISVYFSDSTEAGKINIFFFTVLDCFPLLLILNIPVVLLSEMDELKVLLQTLVHRQEEPNTKAEVREVLDVLEEWPGFNMFRVFTLGRARLVDISSFVVTYIIIFLQFRLTE